MEKSLKEISDLVGGKISPEYESVMINGLENIEGARKGDLIFAVDPHIEEAKQSKASAVILPLNVENFPLPSIHVDDPRAAFAKLMNIFMPKLEIKPGVSDKAHIGENVKLADDVTIMPFAVVDDNAEIESGVVIYPHVYIGQYAKIDQNTIIYSNVTIREYCRVGKNCVIHASTVIGSDGFGFTTKNGIHTKVPQVGNVVIQDDVEIGANVGIDRAAMGSTVIGHGTKIDNLVHIGHNCKIGANCLIVAQTGLSGSTIVGDNVTFGGQVGTSGHLTIGSNSIFAARTGISKSMPENSFCAGFPIQSHADWLKTQAALRQLPEIIKKFRKIESELKK
ncbi:MAG: UDP-3-O-(3-hydroxymyristoyl)glucosamine N-acyltransferase [Selenomonadaceae bacterium]|nr:UDP-3-O-(3-hydroxymyristoyl)glucosamine N-acyltransferase [Selenomonadaceae bacterium]